MKYPVKVQEKLDVLNIYKEDNNLKRFDILHMYPGKLAYPNGYYDSRWFEVVIYDTELATKRKLESTHDCIIFDEDDSNLIKRIKIFADKSTILILRKFAYIPNTLLQSLDILTEEHYHKLYKHF